MIVKAAYITWEIIIFLINLAQQYEHAKDYTDHEKLFKCNLKLTKGMKDKAICPYNFS